jgi:hypothetical protein
VFNLLPVYPLDGGQMLRSLLWYPFGRARSLQIATIIGLIGGVALIGLALWWESLWTGIMAFYLLSQSWRSFQGARALREIEKLPRRAEFNCPVCHASPPVGPFWLCPSCRAAFDPFASSGICPQCHAEQNLTTCPDCHSARPLRSWDATIVDA